MAEAELSVAMISSDKVPLKLRNTMLNKLYGLLKTKGGLDAAAAKIKCLDVERLFL